MRFETWGWIWKKIPVETGKVADEVRGRAACDRG